MPRIGTPPTAYYAHHNHRGDVIVTRNGTSTTGTYDYSAFGNLQAQTGTDICRFKFSSKERDTSTGFSYYGYRFYAPQWQRWVSRDPLEEVIPNIADRIENERWNFYAAFNNAPVNYYDSFGLSSDKVYFRECSVAAKKMCREMCSKQGKSMLDCKEGTDAYGGHWTLQCVCAKKPTPKAGRCIRGILILWPLLERILEQAESPPGMA
jgi:RHS repeat-associated protein